MDDSETSMHRFWLVPGEAMLDNQGLPYGDGTRCTECTEVWIQGMANYDRVVAEHTEKRWARSYRFFYQTDQYVAVVSKGGPISIDDYLVRSSIPGFLERAGTQEYSSRPYAIAREACAFEPRWVSVYQNKKVLKAVLTETPIETIRNVRKYSLKKEWSSDLQKWIGELVLEPMEVREPVYREEEIVDKNGTVLGLVRVPDTETKVVLQEVDEVDNNGQPVVEEVGQKLEYEPKYVNEAGLFVPNEGSGVYRMHYVKVDIFNYCF